MNKENQSLNDIKRRKEGEQPMSPEQQRRETRRRLLKAGALSVPVILTVRSRPVMGQSLGSAGISYGAYFQSQGELMPVLSNENGEPIDEDGRVIDTSKKNHHKDFLFMQDETRRTSGTYTWKDYEERLREDKKKR